MKNKRKIEYLSQYPTKSLYEQYLSRFHDGVKVKTYEAISSHELLVEYVNGNKFIYDSYDGWSSRYIPYDNDSLNEEDSKKEFRRILEYNMWAFGINENELSELLGVSRQMVSRYMTGKSLPSYTILKKMSEVFKCTVNDLFLNF